MQAEWLRERQGQTDERKEFYDDDQRKRNSYAG